MKEARGKLNLTQAGAAKAWGVPLGTLISWENNQRRPPAFALAMLNRLLDGILDTDATAARPGGPAQR